MPRYTVRVATPADSGVILGLVRELADFEKLAHEVVLSEERMRKDFEAGAFECLLAEAEGESAPVGFALYFPIYSTFEGLSFYLEDLYVRPGARGKGCGTLLLQAVAAAAQRRDCARLQWQALDWNSKAVGEHGRPKAHARSHTFTCPLTLFALLPRADFYTSAAVGARERIGEDGTKWLNFIMGRPEIAKLAQGREAESDAEAASS